MKYALTSKDKEFVHTVLENAEAFLKLSNERIENFELIEQGWDSEEEREKIRLSVAKTTKKENIQATGLRSQRLQKVKDLVKAKKMKLKKKRPEDSGIIEKKQEIKIDIDRLRKELERERMLDTEPGYGNKIKAALKDAAEKSHKFIHDKLSHGNHGRKIQREVAP